MNFQSYHSHFETIIGASNPPAPYDNPDYFNYAKLNWSRTNRWLKKGVLTENTKATLASITKPQQWIVITEPWCGDASHVVPFIHMIAEFNSNITVEYELRDAEPFRINAYLTNAGKAIPKLIIKNQDGEDIATWGPRPVACQLLYDTLKANNADFENIKIELQKWYNHNEGVDIQKEICKVLS